MSFPSGHDRTTESSGTEGQHSSFADEAARLTEPLRQEARGAAERQKDYGADQLMGFAEAIRRAARELEPQLPQTAACIESAAGGLERLSGSLRSQSVGDVAGKFVRLANERPAAVFAGAVLVGFVLTRALKNAQPDTEP